MFVIKLSFITDTGSSIVVAAISFKSLNMVGSIFGMAAGVVISVSQPGPGTKVYTIHLTVAVLVGGTNKCKCKKMQTTAIIVGLNSILDTRLSVLYPFFLLD